LQSLSIGERKATLRQTNSIVQDIVSFEPMIQSVTSRAEDLQQAAPASEITCKYENLSKTARKIYEKQKETVEGHEAFIEAGNDFGQWLRVAKERLSKCAEPTGDKEALSTKLNQLKVCYVLFKTNSNLLNNFSNRLMSIKLIYFIIKLI
jgi:nesprin-1